MKEKIGNPEEIVQGISPIDEQWVAKGRKRTSRLVMPTRALGRLHDIPERLCGIQKTLDPSMGNKAFLVMAGDHGVTEEGVSAYPREVTGEMIKTFLAGGAGINVLSEYVGARVEVVDMGTVSEIDTETAAVGAHLHLRKIAPGTANFTAGPAMTRESARRAVMTGFDLATGLFETGVEVIGTGDMGIGNTTASAAIGAVFTDQDLTKMVGRGTGVDDAGLEKKKDVVRRAIDKNRPNPEDGLDVLSKVGGFEIGGIAGCILAGAFHERAVVIDGFISTAGALVAYALCPTVVEYLFAGHCSEEPGHRVMLDHLGLEPILDLGMRLGEGTGAALAMAVMEGAVRVFRDVQTFEEAGVTDKD